MRKKSSPAPVPRACDIGAPMRPVSRATTSFRALPTVAALLAATAALACRRDEAIDPDREGVQIVHLPTNEASSEPPKVVTNSVGTSAEPSLVALPGMGALETPAPEPTPEPSAKPYPVKGGMKHVAPKPIMPAGAPPPTHPTPIPPAKKTPKLGGDVAVVDPTI